MDSDDLTALADRLEQALERIAQLSASRAARPQPSGEAPSGTIDHAALAARLDTTIARLKAAIGDT